ncbi:hypothetical protein LXL04_033420 [Taraxacum kok-saghyz]
MPATSGSSTFQTKQIFADVGWQVEFALPRQRNIRIESFEYALVHWFVNLISFLLQMKPSKKCHFGEWVEEGEKVKLNLEDDHAIVKKELDSLKKK